MYAYNLPLNMRTGAKSIRTLDVFCEFSRKISHEKIQIWNGYVERALNIQRLLAKTSWKQDDGSGSCIM